MKPPTDEQSASAILNARIQIIPRTQLVRWKDNPRQTFDSAELADLEKSIAEHGFLPAWPLLVRPMNMVKVVPDEGEAFSIYVKPYFAGEDAWRQQARATSEEEAVRLQISSALFEIIDGERRDRTAEKRGIEELPCVIRTMTDAEALELALISTLQKKSLSPMEEAVGFQRLDAFLASANPESTDKERYGQMAEKVGRSEAHVRSSLALCRLKGEPAGEAVESGRLPATHAELISRLPTRELRLALTKEVLNKTLYGEGCMPREHLRVELKKYQREIRGASFDPKAADLVPVRNDAAGHRIAGGACTDCPFNTRNNPETETGSQRHCCLNTACFDEKTAAEHEQWRKSVTTDGVSALSYEDNAALWDPTGKRLAPHSRYVELDEVPAAHELRTDLKVDAAKHKWRVLTKGQGLPVVMARDDAGKVHELALHELAARAARENKHAIFRKDETPTETREREQSAPPPTDSDAVPAVEKAMAAEQREKKTKEERLQREAEEAEAGRILDGQIAAIFRSANDRPELPEGFAIALYDIVRECFLDGINLAAARRETKVEDFEKSLRKEPTRVVFATLTEIIIQQSAYMDGGEGTEALVKSFGKLFGTDLKGAVKLVKDQIKDEKAKAAEAAEIEAGMKWKDRREDLANGEAFRFNAAQICENPEVCELALPKSLKITAAVKIALAPGKKREWVVGYVVSAKASLIEPCNATGTKYGSRVLALKTGLAGIKLHLEKDESTAPALARLDAWIASVSAEKAPAKKGAK